MATREAVMVPAIMSRAVGMMADPVTPAVETRRMYRVTKRTARGVAVV